MQPTHPFQIDLAGLNVSQLKTFISELRMKVPSGLKKEQLIMYAEGALKMRQLGIPETVSKKSLELNFTPVRHDPSLDLLTHLLTYGWAITKVPNYDHVAARNEIFDWIHRVSPAFNPEDSSTWTRNNIPFNLHGIFKHYVGHMEAIWKTREACVPIFSSLWQTTDLLSSFDGCCFLTNKGGNKHRQWMHCDQGRIAVHMANVQGVVNLFPNGENDGGTLLMSGSHLRFSQYLERHPVDGISPFFPIDPEDPILSDCPVVKPCLEEGEILLWDSRTFHCNVAPRSDQPRMCIYVSMQPRKGATSIELQKRIKLAKEGRMTGHWCYGPFFSACAKDPNPTYTKETPRPSGSEIASLNLVRRRLIGYEQ